jgi:hypothetical protein
MCKSAKIHGEKKDFLKVDLGFTTRSDIIQPKNLGAMAMFQFLSTFKFLTNAQRCVVVEEKSQSSFLFFSPLFLR